MTPPTAASRAKSKWRVTSWSSMDIKSPFSTSMFTNQAFIKKTFHLNYSFTHCRTEALSNVLLSLLFLFFLSGETPLTSNGGMLVPSTWLSPLVCSPPLRKPRYVSQSTPTLSESKKQQSTLVQLSKNTLNAISKLIAGSLEGWCQESHHLCTQRWRSHVRHGCQPWKVRQVPAGRQVRTRKDLSGRLVVMFERGLEIIISYFWKCNVSLIDCLILV